MPPSPATSSPALAALRAATAAQHAQLDAGLPLSREGATAADYREHLQVLRCWLQACRPALEATCPGDAALLLGWMAADIGPDDAPAATGRADWAQPPAAWGVAYVVQGSQLGGQVLARRLTPSLAPQSTHYLQGRGRETGAHWQGFLRELHAALGDDAAAIAIACRAAAQAFEQLQQAFDARLSEAAS
ncbi:biliverdin-producing heme oxygenase [Roseateles sp. NT4]|uniref:biliverdin-producing heme oxygenase n=1 Tax=Roseateles sp. NT4 TaxID=3453715 RepID=UPI003EEF89B1